METDDDDRGGAGVDGLDDFDPHEAPEDDSDDDGDGGGAAGDGGPGKPKAPGAKNRDGDSSGDDSDSEGDGEGEDGGDGGDGDAPAVPGARFFARGPEAPGELKTNAQRMMEAMAPPRRVVVIEGDQRVTRDMMTIYEATQAIAYRAQMLTTNPQTFPRGARAPGADSAFKLALAEFLRRGSPLILAREVGRRAAPDGVVEVFEEHWAVREMAYPTLT